MLTPPALSVDTIIASVRASHALRIRGVTFLPIGADINTAVYRVEADDGTPYFLKLRRGDFAAVAVAVPAFLHAQGILPVMAPVPTAAGRLWTSGHGFVWILYPFFEGRDGYEAPLSETQWVTFGQSMRAVHSAVLPPALSRQVPREQYEPRGRDRVLAFDREVATRVYDDPTAARLAAFWIAKRDEIRAMVARADALGQALRQRTDTDTDTDTDALCHADVHPGNVLVGAHDTLAIVDWDNPIFAPKERDLMCLGGGIGPIWNDAREEALFYAGYGATKPNAVALAYYRYERIVADVAAYGDQIFEMQGSVEDRAQGLEQLTGQFLPDQVVALAHQTYARLP